jgi:hypothetical protein
MCATGFILAYVECVISPARRPIFVYLPGSIFMRFNANNSLNYTFHSEPLRVFNALGSLLLWELELRWPKRKKSKALAELLFGEFQMAKDDGGGDSGKMWRRWRSWFANESSFASGKLGTANAVLDWTVKNNLLTQVEAEEFEDAFSLLHVIGEGMLDSYDMPSELERLDEFIWQFSQIEEVDENPCSFSYKDLKSQVFFNRENLGLDSFNSTRPNDVQKRESQLLAAFEALDSVGVLIDVAHRANPFYFQKDGKISLLETVRRAKASEEKKADDKTAPSNAAEIPDAPSKTEIKGALNELSDDAQMIVVTLYNLLKNNYGHKKNIDTLATKELNIIINRMRQQLSALPGDSNKPS